VRTDPGRGGDLGHRLREPADGTRGGGLTRRAALRALGLAAAGAAARPRPAAAQGNLASLGPEETVDATMKRLFGGRAIKDGSAAVRVDLPLLAENGAVVPVTVEIASPQTPQSHVKAIYVISDRNRRPLNVKFNLTPAMGQAYVETNLRLGESTDVRAVAELSDGTLLMAKRAVKVTVGGCGE
jgi:sulfur-oxidizing protein SoxY